MTEPKQRSLELPTYLTRILPLWQSPQWLNAERWRQVVLNQPVAMDCRLALINDILASKFEIRARDAKEEDEVASDIDWYQNTVLNPQLPGGLQGFDALFDQFSQDLLTLPIGGNLEPIRFPDGMGPLARPHENGGHVDRLVYIDGATLWPTYDADFPVMQRLQEDINRTVFFQRHEIARAVMSPRTEIRRWGFGMAPPEAIYLAILSLYRGDSYYANLLVDTPEAGLLDLVDMSQKAAGDWIESFEELMAGIDPMKIGVLYEHTKQAAWIPFGRPPTELTLSEVMLRYAQITTAAYGLTINDIGLGDPQKTLAGTIRQDRQSRRSGFATLKEKIRNLINNEILPKYLKLVWIEVDEESKAQKARSFLLYTQALKTAREAGFLSPKDGLEELKRAGHVSPEIEPPEAMEQLPSSTNGKQQSQEELDKVPPAEGGRGEITAKALELGDERIANVPKDSPKFDQMANLIKQGFAEISRKMGDPQMMRLIKVATRALFPVVEQAAIELSDVELPAWKEERLKAWFGEKSEFDTLPNVKKSNKELLKEMEEILEKEDWWRFDIEIANLELLYKLAFEEGATVAAEEAQAFLYTEGLKDSPNIIGLNFNLKNPRTLAQLEKEAAQLVRRVDDGTKFFLKRIITSGVEEGLASPSIAEMIREGAGVEEILKAEGYTGRVIKRVRQEVEGMSEGRTNSIVNTEVNRAESMGRLGQWSEMGLTQKAWRHTGATGPDDPCPVCKANIEREYVEMGFLFDSVFGEGAILTPPGHPGTCHCHIVFSEQEMIEKAAELTIWMGD